MREGGPLLHRTAGRTACDGAELAAALGGSGLDVHAEARHTDARTGADEGDRSPPSSWTLRVIRAVVELREAGRRMNSLAQGGLPSDAAETTAWFARPASGQ